jgi:putative Ca2+/H+ antiporter (TMEM165/GDT1 family)
MAPSGHHRGIDPTTTAAPAVQSGGVGHYAQGSWMEGFLASWSMILVSEIGDKTFFIACLLAMRHPRLIVFSGAILALAAMTVLSALLGVLVPSLLSVRVTQGLAVILFLGFGCKILYDTLCANHEGEEEEDEMAEAAAALGRKDEESGDSSSSPSMSPGSRKWASVLSPVFVQAFTLTFLAEWGDRSQIATIALAAAKNPYAVTVGGILGHSICTGGAVVAGNMIASKISHRTINLTGGVLFVLFGLYTLYEMFDVPDHLKGSS